MNEINANLPPGEQPVEMLNKIRAAKDADVFIERHGAETGEMARIKGVKGGGFLPKAFIGLQAIGIWQMALEQEAAKYRYAPMVFTDQYGEFTLNERTFEWMGVTVPTSK